MTNVVEFFDGDIFIFQSNNETDESIKKIFTIWRSAMERAGKGEIALAWMPKSIDITIFRLDGTKGSKETMQNNKGRMLRVSVEEVDDNI